MSPYERFFKLLYSILGMVLSGAKPLTAVNEHFQELVDQPSPFKAEGVSEKQYLATVVSWMQAGFVHAAHRIVELLLPFYLKPYAELRKTPASADLGDKVFSAVFWRKASTIEYVPDYYRENDNLRGIVSLTSSLNQYLLATEGYDLVGNRSLASKPAGKDFSQRLKTIQEIREMLQLHFFQGLATDDVWPHLLTLLTGAVLFTAIDRDRHKDFRPLLELYLAGNRPCAVRGITIYVQCEM